jgi:O-antigen/teichoic acid export membrane protein
LTLSTRKLASGSLLRVVNLGAQLAVSIAILPFLVSTLGDRMYGFWALAWSIIGYCGFLDFGIGAAVSRYIAGAIGAEDEKLCNRIVSNALVLYTGVAFLVVIISVVIAHMANAFVKIPDEAEIFSNVILILGANFALEFPIRVFGGVLTARLRYDIMSGLKLCTLSIRTAGILVVLCYGYGLLALAIVTAAAAIPEKMAYIYFAKKSYPVLEFNPRYLSGDTVRRLYGYGIYALLIQLTDMLKFNVDSMVIAAFVGVAAVTHYAIATSLITHFMNLIGAVMGVLLPVFSRLETEDDFARMKNAFFLSTKISICIASFVGFGLIFWGRPFIERWMGPDYLDAYPCLVTLVIGCTVGLWQAASQAILFGTSKHKFYAIANAAEATANLALSLLLVRWYGIVGVAVGTMIPMLVINLFVQPVYVCRLTGMPFQEYLNEVARTLRTVFLSLVIPGAVSIIFGAADYGRLSLVGLSSAIAYSLGIWAFAFRPHESKLIREAVFPQWFLGRAIL